MTDPNPQSQIVPSVPQAQLAFQQLTQIVPPIPPQAWTTEALMEFHARNEKIVLDNNARQEKIALDSSSKIEGQRRREHFFNIFFLAIVAVIILAGLGFMWRAVSGGKEIILAAGSFAAGVLAGRGTK